MHLTIRPAVIGRRLKASDAELSAGPTRNGRAARRLRPGLSQAIRLLAVALVALSASIPPPLPAQAADCHFTLGFQAIRRGLRA